MDEKKVYDLKKVIKRESYFSTLAKKEGKDASRRYKLEKKKGLKESAKDTKWEIGVDNKFSKIRNEKSKSMKIKLNKIKKVKK